MEGLTQLVKVDVHPQDLPEFFWYHLEKDMELLGAATGKVWMILLSLFTLCSRRYS